MSVAGGCLIREAEPGLDDDAVAALMVDYLTWAIERLASDYGVDEPPTHLKSLRDFNICGSFSSGARLSPGSPASPRRPGMWPGSP